MPDEAWSTLRVTTRWWCHALSRNFHFLNILKITLVQVSVHTTSIFLLQVSTHTHFTPISFILRLNKPFKTRQHDIGITQSLCYTTNRSRYCLPKVLTISFAEALPAIRFPFMLYVSFYRQSSPIYPYMITSSMWMLTPMLTQTLSYCSLLYY